MTKKCSKCKVEKDKIEFYKQADKRDGLRAHCKSCCAAKNAERKDYFKEYNTNYYRENSDKIKKQVKEYSASNKEKMRENKRVYMFNRRRKDPMFKLLGNLRHRTRQVLFYKDWTKTTKFMQYIGCSRDELKFHLESQFTPGMTWDNYGKWHIDHIIPLSSASTAEEMYKLCHYTNLQPMWGEDNIRKGAKLL